MKKLFKNISIIYLIFTLPITILYLQNEWLRYQLMQRVTYLKSKLIGIETVRLGDSITSAGRNFFMPFETLNYGANGLLAYQIANTFPNRGEKYKILVITAGTNDVLRDNFDIKIFEKDYKYLLNKTSSSKSKIIINLIPLTEIPKLNLKINESNLLIKDLAKNYYVCVVDINKKIAPNGILLEEFSNDGIHLSKKTYKKWEEIRIKNCN